MDIFRANEFETASGCITENTILCIMHNAVKRLRNTPQFRTDSRFNESNLNQYYVDLC